jgi:hypothetical protein
MKLDRLLADKFNLAEEGETVLATVEPETTVVTATPIEDTLESDSEKARATLTTLIDKSVGALDELLRVASESENPRAYEVVAQMVKATADMSKDLLQIHKMKRDATPADSEVTKSPTNIKEQNIYVGTTNDFIRLMAQKKEADAIHV